MTNIRFRHALLARISATQLAIAALQATPA
jgi:hypothetical protein